MDVEEDWGFPSWVTHLTYCMYSVTRRVYTQCTHKRTVPASFTRKQNTLSTSVRGTHRRDTRCLGWLLSPVLWWGIFCSSQWRPEVALRSEPITMQIEPHSSLKGDNWLFSSAAAISASRWYTGQLWRSRNKLSPAALPQISLTQFRFSPTGEGTRGRGHLQIAHARRNAEALLTSCDVNLNASRLASTNRRETRAGLPGIAPRNRSSMSVLKGKFFE